MLKALEKLNDVGLILRCPIADTDGRILFEQINRFCQSHPMAQSYTSLGQLRYLSCIKHVDGVVGNSSSGLAEVPSFQKGTINIGDRQRGRLRASSVIDCSTDQASITQSLHRLFSLLFLAKLLEVRSPYGNGGASAAIVETLEQRTFGDLLKKHFFDLQQT